MLLHQKKCLTLSKAFSVDDTWANFVELCLRDPHGVEGGESCVDGASEPGRILALWVLNNLGAMVRWRQSVQLTPQSLRDEREECIATSQHDVFEEVTSDVLVTLHDRVVDVLLETLTCNVCSLSQMRLEEDFGAGETLASKDNLTAIW